MAAKNARIEKRKRLESLFDRGGYVRLNVDTEGRPIVEPESHDESDILIWVGPPSPLQREMAIREGQARRARVMLDARDREDSDTWLTIHNFVRGLSMGALVDYVLELDEQEHYSQARRDILQQKEWEDINQLRDAMRQYEEAGSPVGDPEWDKFLARDQELGDQIYKRAMEIRDDARAGYMHMPRGKVEDKALDKRIDQAGSGAFMTTYEEWMLFYACRDDEDHTELYFDDPNDIKKLPTEVHGALAEKLQSFISDGAEAKN